MIFSIEVFNRALLFPLLLRRLLSSLLKVEITRLLVMTIVEAAELPFHNNLTTAQNV